MIRIEFEYILQAYINGTRDIEKCRGPQAKIQFKSTHSGQRVKVTILQLWALLTGIKWVGVNLILS
jgi:hypothetical protein